MFISPRTSMTFHSKIGLKDCLCLEHYFHLAEKSSNSKLGRMSMNIKFLYSSLFIGALLVSAPTITNAKDYGDLNKPMKFETGATGGNCSSCVWISAIGVIDEDTPKNFEKYMKDGGGNLVVNLHSPGGNLLAGMELGRLFRKYGLSTTIAKTSHQEGKDYPDYIATTDPGICASACAYAFLGGGSRSIPEGSKIGFHQFYKPNTSKPVELDGVKLSSDQLVSGLIAAYLVQMGIDARVLTLASLVGKDNLISPDDQDLKKLKVINSSEDFNPWSIEAFKGGIRASATRDDPEWLEKSVSAYCVNPKKKTIFEIKAAKTQDYNGEKGEQELRANINEVELYLNENAASRDHPLIVPPENVGVRITDDAFYILIALPAEYREKIFGANRYAIAVDTQHYLFGSFISVDFKPTDLDKQMLKFAWSNCF